MRSSGMPTENNDSPVEMYSDFKQRTFVRVTNTVSNMLDEIAGNSLKKEDKKQLLFEMKYQIEKDLVTKF